MSETVASPVLCRGDSVRVTFDEGTGRGPIDFSIMDVETCGSGVICASSDGYHLGYGFSPDPGMWRLEWGGVDIEGVNSIDKC